MGRYDKMTSDEEHDILADLIHEKGVEHILSIGNVFSELREHFNNDILERWEEKQGPPKTASDWLDWYDLRETIVEKVGRPEITPEQASHHLYCVLGAHTHYEGDLSYYRRENPDATQDDIQAFHDMTEEGIKYVDWLEPMEGAINDLLESVDWKPDDMYR